MSHAPLGDLSKLTARYADRRWFRVAGAVITLFVFFSGFNGLLMLPEGKKMGPLACLYENCEFFFFLHGNPLQLSMEHWPDHKFAVILIGITAFGGPILTAAVFVILVNKLAAQLGNRQHVRATGHIVILGCGREGIHWAEYLHKERKQPIVIVNRNDEGPQMGQAREIVSAVIIGDMQDNWIRERAGVLNSKMVVVCTGDELANIDTARAIEEDAKEAKRDGPMIFCRVVSQSLLFFMKDSARNEETRSRIRFFNIYDFVAKDRIQEIQKPASDKLPRIEAGPVHLIICGFGRFGQAVLHAAGADEALFNRLSAVDIVDLRARELLAAYRFSAPDTDHRILNNDRIPNKELNSPSPKKLTEACPSGILNHALWDTLLEEKPAGAQRLVFICTDNDVANLEHALAIRRHIRRQKHQGPPIQAVVVMRQLKEPKSGAKDLFFYATMSRSTDEQIERLIADFNGRWEGKVKDPNGEEMPIAFTFKVDGEKLTGTAESRMGEAHITSGKVMRDEISFSVKLGDHTIAGRGKLAKNTLTIDAHEPWGKMELKQPSAKQQWWKRGFTAA